MEMIKPHLWFQNFLKDRELFQPTGRPLYSYKMKEHEFVSIAEILKNNSHTLTYWDACFVLYATEWWRREYSGGHWSWDPIMNSISQNNSIQSPDRSRIVESGFSQWNRKIYQSKSGREFLGTVVIECGIPLNVLRDNHYLAEIISETYKEIGGVSSIEYEYFDLVRSIANRKRLPETLNKDPFIQVILETIQKLVKLNREFELSKQESPVSVLDSKYANWREEFSVRIDNEIAKKFLDNLLSEVSKIEIPSDFSVSTFCELEHKENNWRPVVYLSIESGIHRYQNLGLKKEEYSQLSNKVEIFIDDEKGERRIGFAFKISQKEGFRIDGLNKYRVPNSNHQLFLFLSDPKSGQRIDLETPANVLSFDEPLIFSKKDSKWRIKTTGSARVSPDTYRIIVGANSRLICDDFEEIDQLAENKKLIEIRSECEIQDGDNLYKIRYSNQSKSYRYEFHPPDNYHTIDFHRKENKNVYLGFPKVYQFDENGNLSSRILSGIEYYDGNQWTNVNMNTNLVGRLKFRLKKDGETHFCRTISILPRDFKIEFMSNGASRFIRKVVIHKTSDLLLTIKSHVQNKIYNEGQGKQIIEFIESPDVDIPESFLLELQNNMFSAKVGLRVPYPSNEFYFYTSEQVLKNRQNLFLQKLHGIRLAIPNLGSNTVTEILNIKLVDNQLNETVQIGRVLKKEPLSENTSLISFQDQISRLFSLSENPDARVEVSCQQKKVEIRQFVSKPWPTENETISIKMEEDGSDSIIVKAFRLDQPFLVNRIQSLNKVGKNEWRLPDTEGVWFIYPGHDSSQLFRPIARKKLKNERIEDQYAKEIHHASLFQREHRLEALARLIDQMCKDFNHPDWNRLFELYKETSHLPLATNDIWTAIAHNDLGIIGLALRLPIEIIKQLTDEFSIIWHQIHIKKWIECFTHYKNYVQNQFPEQSELLLNHSLYHIENMLELASVRWIFEGNDQPIPYNLLESLIGIQLNGEEGNPGIRGRHDNEKWPDQLYEKLIPIFTELPQEFRHLLPRTIPRHQQPVIYLPFILAIASTTTQILQIPEFTPIERFRIMEIIDFDEDWFKTIYDYIKGYTWSQLTPNKINHE